MRQSFHRPSSTIPALLLGCWMLGTALTARAQTLFWDVNGNTPGAVTTGNSPTGTWATGSGNWNTSSTGTGGTLSNWTDFSNAVFSAGTNGTGAYTVTVSGTVGVANLTVEEGTPTFSGGTIQFSGTPDFNIASGTATINSVVDDQYYGGFNKTGAGTLVLGGNNTFQGSVTVNAGTLTLTTNNSLGATGTWGNTVASGATLALQGGITVSEGGFNISGTGASGNGAIRNVSGNNTLAGAITLMADSTVTSTAGTLTLSNDLTLTNSSTSTATNLTTAGAGNIALSGNINGAGSFVQSGSGSVTVAGAMNAGGTITQSGTGSLTFNGVVNNSTTITQSGSGTLTFAGTTANSVSGVLNINAGTVAFAKTAGVTAFSGSALNIASGGTLRLDANNQISDSAGPITVAAGGTFNVNGKTEAVNSVFSSGTLALGTGTLTLGGNGGNSSLAGSVTGAGTLIKGGAGTLALLSNIVLAGTLELNAGTLALGGFNLTAGTLHVTGNSTIDFGAAGNSTLSLTNFIIDAGKTLTITNWTGAADYFYTQGWTGAAFDTNGVAPMNQVVFTGVAGGSHWQSLDKQITPVPEPSTYGALLLLGAGGLAAWRRFRASARA